MLPLAAAARPPPRGPAGASSANFATVAPAGDVCLRCAVLPAEAARTCAAQAALEEFNQHGSKDVQLDGRGGQRCGAPANACGAGRMRRRLPVWPRAMCHGRPHAARSSAVSARRVNPLLACSRPCAGPAAGGCDPGGAYMHDAHTCPSLGLAALVQHPLLPRSCRPQEDAILVDAHRRLGNRWTEISAIFGDRWAALRILKRAACGCVTDCQLPTAKEPPSYQQAPPACGRERKGARFSQPPLPAARSAGPTMQ